MFNTDNFIYESKRITDLEFDDAFIQNDKLVSSTPIKLKNRRSYSLIDISNVDDEQLHYNKKLTVSIGTIGSGSQGSVCKDSGYVYSESNTSLNSTKDFKKVNELLQDIKFKNVLITELQESNHSLRLKYAEAENRIAELRLKCEAHCECCNLKNTTKQGHIQSNSHLDVIVNNRKIIDYCVKPQKPDYSPTLPIHKVGSYISNAISEISTLKDDSLTKVKCWQENLHASDPCLMTAASYNKNKVINSKHYANNIRTPILQTRIIGDRSVRISPVSNVDHVTATIETKQLLADQTPVNDVTLMIEDIHNLNIGDNELPLFVENEKLDKSTLYKADYDSLTTRSEEIKATTNNENERISSSSSSNYGTSTSVSFQQENNNGKSFSFIDHKLEIGRKNLQLGMERIKHGMNDIAEKGKLDSTMGYKPWETSDFPFNFKPGFLELML